MVLSAVFAFKTALRNRMNLKIPASMKVPVMMIPAEITAETPAATMKINRNGYYTICEK